MSTPTARPEARRGASSRARTFALVAMAALASAALALGVRTLLSSGALETESFRFLAPEALFLLAVVPPALP